VRSHSTSGPWRRDIKLAEDGEDVAQRAADRMQAAARSRPPGQGHVDPFRLQALVHRLVAQVLPPRLERRLDLAGEAVDRGAGRGALLRRQRAEAAAQRRDLPLAAAEKADVNAPARLVRGRREGGARLCSIAVSPSRRRSSPPASFAGNSDQGRALVCSFRVWPVPPRALLTHFTGTGRRAYDRPQGEVSGVRYQG
jgi:hypothetical protein